MSDLGGNVLKHDEVSDCQDVSACIHAFTSVAQIAGEFLISHPNPSACKCAPGKLSAVDRASCDACGAGTYPNFTAMECAIWSGLSIALLVPFVCNQLETKASSDLRNLISCVNFMMT